MKKCSVTNICVLFFISSTSIILYIFMHSKGQVSQVFDPSGNTLIQTSELAKDIWKSNGTKTKFLESKTVVTEKLDSQVLDDKARVLAAAKKITQNGGTLLVSFINNAYLPFAYSWLCNVQTMNLNKQILVIAADKETEESLKKKRPDIAAVSVSGFTMKGNQRYTRAGYVRIGIKRTQILNWILQENIGIFFLFEFDCLWVRNPVPELTRFTEHDLIITPVAQQPGMVAIGFYYMAPTDRMKQLWQELTRRLMVLDKKTSEIGTWDSYFRRR